MVGMLALLGACILCSVKAQPQDNVLWSGKEVNEDLFLFCVTGHRRFYARRVFRIHMEILAWLFLHREILESSLYQFRDIRGEP